jgi:hypothetical protein
VHSIGHKKAHRAASHRLQVTRRWRQARIQAALFFFKNLLLNRKDMGYFKKRYRK